MSAWLHQKGWWSVINRECLCPWQEHATPVAAATLAAGATAAQATTAQAATNAAQAVIDAAPPTPAAQALMDAWDDINDHATSTITLALSYEECTATRASLDLGVALWAMLKAHHVVNKPTSQYNTNVNLFNLRPEPGEPLNMLRIAPAYASLRTMDLAS